MHWGFCLLALGCRATTDASPGFRVELSGAVNLSAAGRVEQGAARATPDAYYTISLGGRDGPAALVFTRRSPAPPTPGRYLVGEGQLNNDGFSALIITGQPSHPTGVFQVQHGVLRLTDAGGEHLTGDFELHAAGFFAELPEQDQWELTARGHFTAPVEDGTASFASPESTQ